MNKQTTYLNATVTRGNLIDFYTSNNYVFNFNINNSENPINIINVRSPSRIAGKFDDTQIVAYYDDANHLHIISFDVTVDPSKHYSLNPINKKGAAIVVPNQYLKGWSKGRHRNKYDALVQGSDMLVIRDNNKDGILDIPNGKDYSYLLCQTSRDSTFKVLDRDGIVYTMEQGMFGINCHRASSWKILDIIGLYGAGCTVHNNPKDFIKFMTIINKYSRKDIVHYNPVWVDFETLNKYL